MKIVTSGFPKAGNHALVKACQLLGLVCSVQHLPHGTPVDRPHVFIKRDPRNVLVSWLRFKDLPVTPGMFISAFRHFESAPLVQEMAAYAGWLADPRALVVRYEDLIGSDAEMRRIAHHMDVPYIAGAWDHLPRLTYSWRWPHSDYSAIWSPEVDAVWRAEGGPALLAQWGY